MVPQRTAYWYRCVTAAIVASLLAGSSFQASVAAAQASQGVANQQVVISGGVVTVAYDLTAADPDAVFSVALEVSEDGGRTFKPAATVSGDVGADVKTGASHQIKWDAQKDVDTLQLSDIRYRVAAQRVPREMPPPTPYRIQQTPIPPAPTKISGRRFTWPAVGAIGAGAVVTGTAFGPLKATKFVSHTLDWSHSARRTKPASTIRTRRMSRSPEQQRSSRTVTSRSR
jgi:hypothetical protein